MNQSLVDDGLVDKEKLGGSNYYWSFPAKQDRLTQLQHEKVLAAIRSLQTVLDETTVALQDAKRGREEEDDAIPTSTTTTSTTNDITTTENIGVEVDTNPPHPRADDDDDDDDGTDGEARRVTNKIQLTTARTMGGRAAKLQRLDEIAKERAVAGTELAALQENDPQAIADLEKELQLVTQAAHRWTDNIFNCQSYLTKKRNMDKKEAAKILGITSAFDCTLGDGGGAALLCVCLCVQTVVSTNALALLPHSQNSTLTLSHFLS